MLNSTLSITDYIKPNISSETFAALSRHWVQAVEQRLFVICALLRDTDWWDEANRTAFQYVWSLDRYQRGKVYEYPLAYKCVEELTMLVTHDIHNPRIGTWLDLLIKAVFGVSFREQFDSEFPHTIRLVIGVLTLYCNFQRHSLAPKLLQSETAPT